MTARWQAFARELAAGRYDGPHLEQLRARLDPAQAQAELEREIVREMAAALARTTTKLEDALARLATAAHAVDEAADEAGRSRAIATFNARRAEALAARLELVIHREAIGLRNSEAVERAYPVPGLHPGG